MLPIFSNPPGLYALLGIPAILAIHFLQNRSKRVTTSTLFLIEALTPESRTGRVWEKLRNSLALWMQILAILLLTWVITKPRWLQDNSWQTIVFVVDDSLKMQVFKQNAIQAVRNDMAVVRSAGIPTHWVLMASSSHRTPLYRGDEPDKLIAALDQWTPNSGEHDAEPSLRTAQAVVGQNGAVRFVTHSKKRVPPWQTAVGVGYPLDNVGFVGLIPEEQAGEGRWRVSVKNNSSTAQRRDIEIRMGGSSSREQITLNPLSVTELKMSLPPGIDSMELRLTPDGFEGDDILPIVRNTPKPLPVHLGIDGPSRDFFNKLLSTVPGVKPSDSGNAQVSIVKLTDLSALPARNAIVLAGSSGSQEGIQMVTAENHDLTRDLAWGGLLVPGPGSLVSDKPKQNLLWSGSHPLAWLQQQTLVLNWDWDSSNADRIPATVLMLRRYLEDVQSKAPGYWSANVATSARVSVPGSSMIRFTPINGPKTEKNYTGTMPAETGYADVFADREMTRPLFRGALFPSDARQGDFSECASFEQGSLNQQRMLEQISSPDPLVPLWLFLAGTALVIAWIPGKRERNQTA